MGEKPRLLRLPVKMQHDGRQSEQQRMMIKTHFQESLLPSPLTLSIFKPTLHSPGQLACRAHPLMYLIDSIIRIYTCGETFATVHLLIL